MSARPGVFAVSRKIWTHAVLDEPGKPFSRREAWLWLLSEAAWQDEERQRGSAAVILHRGQVCYSLRFMAGAWRWPVAKVRRFLTALERNEMVTIGGPEAGTGTGTPTGTGTGTHSTLLSVCNYTAYQFGVRQTGTPTGTGTGTTDRHKLKEENNTLLRKGASRASNVVSLDPENPADTKAALFAEGRAFLAALGKKPDAAGKLIGRWLRDARDDAGLVLGILRDARGRQLADPAAWIMGAIKERDERAALERKRFLFGRQ